MTVLPLSSAGLRTDGLNTGGTAEVCFAEEASCFFFRAAALSAAVPAVVAPSRIPDEAPLAAAVPAELTAAPAAAVPAAAEAAIKEGAAGEDFAGSLWEELFGLVSGAVVSFMEEKEIVAPEEGVA